MSQTKLNQPYEPNPILRAIYDRLFESIDVDESWVDSVQRLAQQGVVVHVLQTLNFVEFLVLDHVTKLHGLPRIRFVNDLGLWVLNPMGKGWLNALWPKRRPEPSEELRSALALGGSAALFLKRRANVVNVATSGTLIRNTEPKEGDQLVRTLFEFQRQADRPIVLLPAIFVWTQHPTRDELTARDLLIGPPAESDMGQLAYSLVKTLSFAFVNARNALMANQQRSKDSYDTGVVERIFTTGQKVFLRIKNLFMK